MKEDRISQKAVVVFLFSYLLLCNYSFGKYSGGTGEPNAPYQIATTEDLNDIGNHVEDFNKCFVMINDVNLSAYTGTQFNLIGSESEPFTGVFDGNGHAIYSFTYEDSGYSDESFGLFRYVEDVNAKIINLGLIDSYIDTGELPWGTLIGTLVQGEMTNCFVEDGNIRGWFIGGLVNGNGGTIKNCRFRGNVAGTCAGGLVETNAGTIEDCFVECTSEFCKEGGGFVVSNWGSINRCFVTGSIGVYRGVGSFAEFNGGDIINCYSMVDTYPVIMCPSHLGGLVNRNTGLVQNCYSTGRITASSSSGGLIAENTGTVSSSFWDVETSSKSTSAGGTGLTTVEMQTENTFTAAGWDFNDVWAICETTNYPRLMWQIPTGDIACPDGVDFIDVSFLVEHWLDTDCGISDDCGGADIDLSGDVDFGDFAILAADWLEGL